MKNIFATEKLLILFVWCASLLLLGSIHEASIKHKPAEGAAEAASLAAEMDSSWSELARQDAEMFFEAAASCNME